MKGRDPLRRAIASAIDPSSEPMSALATSQSSALILDPVTCPSSEMSSKRTPDARRNEDERNRTGSMPAVLEHPRRRQLWAAPHAKRA